MKPFQVTLEGMAGVFDAYSEGERWNGWHVPYFTHAQVEAIAYVWNMQVGCFAGFDGNAWLFCGANPECIEKVSPVEIDGLRVFKIGEGWCWLERERIE